MVVSDLSVVGVSVSPAEAHAPLIIDADAVMPLAIPGQLFQPVAGRNPQILERLRRIEDSELP